MRLKFHIIGGTGQLCDVGFFFDKEGGPPTNRATLTQANSGTLSNNIITGIQAVSGFQYEVLWQLQDDGVGVGEQFGIFPAAIVEFN